MCTTKERKRSWQELAGEDELQRVDREEVLFKAKTCPAVALQAHPAG
jgi:hypothetical protein